MMQAGTLRPVLHYDGVMKINENNYDRALNIRTSGRDDSRMDAHRNPYEPTPYSVLERLAHAGEITRSDTLLDYGCGKGRTGIFLSAETGCRSIGIDYNENVLEDAFRNLKNSGMEEKVSFVRADAGEYDLPDEVTACYFFNPFSVEILRKVFRRINESYYRSPREIHLYFYYPSDEYEVFLQNADDFYLSSAIDCTDLFDGFNVREKTLIVKRLHFG